MGWLRRALYALTGAGVSFGGLVTALGWWLSSDGYSGPVSDHFDGTVFVNTEPTDLPGFRKMVRMVQEGRGPAWEERTVPPHDPPPERVSGEGMRATFVNHATVLVQHDGMNILTDPIWSERCSAVQWAGPARHHAPGLSLDELPPVDVVLISHNHYDHLDVDTLALLAKRDDPTLVVPLGNASVVAGLGFSRVVELDWEQTTTVGPLTIVGQEVRHFSSRGLFDRQRTLWMGFVVKGDAGSWYFAGDTGYGKHFAATGKAHGPFRLTLLPIGAYAPRWFMSPIHMDPAQAVQAHRDLGSPQSMGVHFGTFQLTREAQDAPMEELAAARRAQGVPDAAFIAPRPGQGLGL